LLPEIVKIAGIAPELRLYQYPPERIAGIAVYELIV